MFNPQGISALDPTVALLGKELQANNVPPGQEAQYFQSKGRPLSPQLAFMIQANQRLQQDSQMSQAKPPQGTVADDLSAAIVQKANAAVAQRPPQMNPRMQGVAQLPQQAVGQPKGMAAGGIIAFSGEGRSDVQSDGGNIYGSMATDIGEGIGGLWEGAKRFGKKMGKNLNFSPYYYPGPDAETEAAMEAESAAKGPLIIPGTAQQAPPGKIGGPPLPGGSTSAAANFARSPAGPVKPSTPASRTDDPMSLLMAEMRKDADKNPEAEAARLREKDKNNELSAFEAKKLAALEARGSTSAADKKKDMLMQLAAASFGSVGKSRNLAQGLGKIGAGFSEGAIGINQKYKDASNLMDDAKLKIEEAQATRRAGFPEKAEKEHDDAVKQYRLGLAKQYELQETERRHREQQDLGYAQIQGQKDIAGMRISAATRAAAQKGGFTENQIAQLRLKAEDKVDPESVRTEVAKSLKIKHPPVPGVDRGFDERVENARLRLIDERVQRYMEGARSSGGPDLSKFVVSAAPDMED